MASESQMSTTVVFVGPSLSPTERGLYEAKGVLVRPPLAQADLLAYADRKQHHTLVIIDGFYREVPSIWHKEILLALQNGHTVIGAASLGALRAAELSIYGMRGVGRIYDWFADQTFLDDADVALLHTPCPDYEPLTVTVADVHATFIDAGLGTHPDYQRALRLVRSIHFELRTTVTLKRTLQQAGLNEFSTAIASSFVPQKKLDTLEAIDYALTLTATQGASQESANVKQWKLNHTVLLDGAINRDSSVIAPGDESSLINNKEFFLSFFQLEQTADYALIESQALVIKLMAHLFDALNSELDQQSWIAFRDHVWNGMVDRGEIVDDRHIRNLGRMQIENQLLKFYKATVVSKTLSRFSPNDNIVNSVYSYLALSEPHSPVFAGFKNFCNTADHLSGNVVQETGESEGFSWSEAFNAAFIKAYRLNLDIAGLKSRSFLQISPLQTAHKLMTHVRQKSLGAATYQLLKRMMAMSDKAEQSTPSEG